MHFSNAYFSLETNKEVNERVLIKMKYHLNTQLCVISDGAKSGRSRHTVVLVVCYTLPDVLGLLTADERRYEDSFGKS